MIRVCRSWYPDTAGYLEGLHPPRLAPLISGGAFLWYDLDMEIRGTVDEIIERNDRLAHALLNKIANLAINGLEIDDEQPLQAEYLVEPSGAELH
jgi:hypothetical protein